MDRPTRPAPFAVLRASLILGLVTGVGLLMVLPALRAAADGRFTAEVVAGAAVALVAAVLALLPVWVATRRGGAEAAAPGVLVGMVVRLGLTVVPIAILAVASSLHPLALAASAVGWYLLLLLVEIVLLYRFLMRAGSAPGEEAAA